MHGSVADAPRSTELITQTFSLLSRLTFLQNQFPVYASSTISLPRGCTIAIQISGKHRKTELVEKLLLNTAYHGTRSVFHVYHGYTSGEGHNKLDHP